MKVRINKQIIGYTREGKYTYPRQHAVEDDVLDVILRNETHFVCDSLRYPGTPLIVFPSQCFEIISEEEELIREDEKNRRLEKYYNVYQTIDKPDIDDPFYNAFQYEN